MHLTQKNRLKELSCKGYEPIQQLSDLSKTIFYVVLHSVKQRFFKTTKEEQIR
jgi:hypothetical protein